MTPKRVVASTLVLLVAIAAAVMGGWSVPDRADALSGSDFDPSNIISDANFYNANAMSQTEIQSFLSSKVSCQTSSCLAVGRFATSSKAADAMCNAYAGGGTESTAAIIFKVQQACGISAKVILVTLQKEQGLITAAAPTTGQLNIAMGYACPDTSGCDTSYYGVFNQIYSAAHQLVRYGNPPGTSNYFTWFPVGSPSAVRYSPSPGCPAPVITIKNLATAALYYYTPYQPDQAALANLYGAGGSCSSYGNRNFWVYYNQWFGSPTGTVDPLASLDDVSVRYTDTGAGILVSGWAIERSAPATTALVDIYIDQPNGTTKGYEIKANTPRPDVGAVYTAAGPNHGYQSTFPATLPGTYNVCVFPMTGGAGGWLLGCRSVTVNGTPAVGSLDSVGATATATGATLTASGWGFDPTSPATAVTATATVTGPTGAKATATMVASGSRPDVAGAYPAAGPAHGFLLPVTVPAGPAGAYQLCVTISGHTAAGKADGSVGCRTVQLGASNPAGVLDSATISLGADGRTSILFSGWAIDNAWLSTSIPVDVYIDRPNGTTAAQRVPTTGSRTDIARIYPGAGAAHGFSGSLVLSQPGTYNVCGFAIGQSPFGAANAMIGCLPVTVPQVTPIGSLDGFWMSATAGAAQVNASGWALDQGAPGTSIPVDLYLDQPDGTVKAIRTASTNPRDDIGRAFPGMGSLHGFTQSFTVTKAGTYRLCAYGIAQSTYNRGNALIGCRSLTITANQLVGSLDWVTVGGTASNWTISASGWAVDPAVPTSPATVSIEVTKPDNTVTSLQVPASGARADVGRVFPAFGSAHGFSGTVVGVTQPGTYKVCAKGVPLTPFGSTTLLGCTQVVVK